MAKKTTSLQTKEKALLDAVAKYDYAALKARLRGYACIYVAIIFLATGLLFNFYIFTELFESNIIEKLDVFRSIPINVFLMAGFSFFAGLGAFNLRVSKDRENKALDAYLNSIYRL